MDRVTPAICGPTDRINFETEGNMTKTTDAKSSHDQGSASSHCSCGADVACLHLLSDIRAAAGDPKGTLMQDELVEKIRNMRNETIQECAEVVANQGPGADYLWMPGSAFGNIASKMSDRIKRMLT